MQVLHGLFRLVPEMAVFYSGAAGCTILLSEQGGSVDSETGSKCISQSHGSSDPNGASVIRISKDF